MVSLSSAQLQDYLTEEIKENEGIKDTLSIELTGDIESICNTITVTTKNNVMQRISNVFAKLYKGSRKVGNEVVNEAKNRLIKKLIDLGIEYGPKLLEWIVN